LEKRGGGGKTKTLKDRGADRWAEDVAFKIRRTSDLLGGGHFNAKRNSEKRKEGGMNSPSTKAPGTRGGVMGGDGKPT